MERMIGKDGYPAGSDLCCGKSVRLQMAVPNVFFFLDGGGEVLFGCFNNSSV